MTTMRDALVRAMELPSDSEIVRYMNGQGYPIADVDTMSQAIHDVYCGIMADHSHPNDKDRQQAQQMLDAIARQHA
jgi:hypothetical protein